MHVQQWGPREQWLPNQLAKRADSADLGPGVQDPGGRGWLIDALGLVQVDLEFARRLRYGRCLNPAAPASWPVQWRDNEHRTVHRFAQLTQHDRREL